MIAYAIAVLTASALAEGPAPALSESSGVSVPPSASLDELLSHVRSGLRVESAEQKRREQSFLAAKQQQDVLLREALASKDVLSQRSEELERIFARNEVQIAELQRRLRERLGTMGDLFGLVRQVAGDTRGQIDASLVSAQFPGRDADLAQLAQSKELPSLRQLESLWFHLQQEMTESGKVVRFRAPVIDSDGAEALRDVVRVGSFNAVSDGKYLRWLPGVGQLAELGRQPAARYLATAQELEQASEGFVRFAVDPSRGSILSLLVQTPGLWERIRFGGAVGYMIIALGIITLLLALVRLVFLSHTHARVRAQQKTDDWRNDNPLGRILGVASPDKPVAPETLERRLDEAIIRESGRLDRFLWAIKVVSVVAPLMGLLGTVTGMIRTFQAITLFGTGDPKLMASGISEALVTTMLGLVIAIPLVLLHSLLSNMSRRITVVLEEQTAGMIAARVEQLEEEDAHDAAA